MRAYDAVMGMRRFVFAGLLLAGMALCMAGCTWNPVARKVQPEVILPGAARLEQLLDAQGRYALITRFDESNEDETEFAIVDWNNKAHCNLPKEVVRIDKRLLGPTALRTRGPNFFLAVAIQVGDKQHLRFVDHECKLHGDYDAVSLTTANFALDDDGRELLIYGNGSGTVAIADPWTNTGQVLAEKVRLFAQVTRASMVSSPQLFWFVEDNKLTQRALDGTLVLTLGEQVKEFSQGLFDTLRVAYVDGSNLYEAKAPNYEPTLVAENACTPVYRGTDLELFEPCADQQLIRVGLYTGAIERFDEGVYYSAKDTGFLMEFARTRDEKKELQFFVMPPGGTRMQVVPAFRARPLVIDTTRLAGVMLCAELPPDPAHPCMGDGDRSFVIWNVNGSLLRLWDQVGDVLPFVDIRQSSYVWLMLSDVVDGLGTLSTFGEYDLSLSEVGTSTPLRSPLGSAPLARGFSIELLPMYPEPLLVHISDAQHLTREPRLSRGTLKARLLSGKLASVVDDDVTSYAVVSAPLPGILYGVEEGERPGLWFAAL